MTVLAIHLVLTLAWVAITGSTHAGNVLLGFGATYAVLWWVRPVLGPTRYFEKLPAGLVLAAGFAWELVKSNFRVAYDVITPKANRRPGIVAVPLDAKAEFEIMLLANLVTLTPGTLSLDVSTDRSVLYVHAMFIDEDEEEVRRSIKQRFERRVIALLR